MSLTRTPSEPAELRKQHYPKCLQAPRVPVDEAVDVLCVLSGLQTYLLLEACGWTSQR